LRKHPADNAAIISEVSLHLDLATIARSLQPDRVLELDDAQLAEAIAKLTKASVQFPHTFHESVLSRRMVRLRKTVLDNKFDPATCDLLIDVMAPFGNVAMFDCSAPRLRDVPSLDKPTVFVESFVEKFLVAAISHVEEGLDKVRYTANKLYDLVEPVDPMALSTREAALRRELVDATLALRGCSAPLTRRSSFDQRLSSSRWTAGKLDKGFACKLRTR
jgi:hypothetical protein